MIVKTDDLESIKPFLKKLYQPPFDSHKGQNGKILIIGGSTLFHAASIWAAEVSTHFVDMVHYASTVENNEIFKELKKKFRGGMVVSRNNLDDYIKEDDAILIGPGMVRDYPEEEAEYSKKIVEFVAEKFPYKKFVFDAGAIQVMDPKILLKFKEKPIVTPHQQEFKKLFGEDISKKSENEVEKIVEKVAKEYNCVVVLKKVSIIISDGKETHRVEGGNAGLTKGGTGDVLAGLITSLYARNDPILSSVVASWAVKKTVEKLFLTKGYWYNVDNLIENIANTLYSALKEV